MEDDDEEGREEASLLGSANLNEPGCWSKPRIVVDNGPVTIVEMRKGRLWRPRRGGDAHERRKLNE